jgi:pimeloyl-ACP methyl ester carboxylesterase
MSKVGRSRAFGSAHLAGDLTGRADGRSPLVLLHGLTFDRRMWTPALAELERRDPGRQVLTLDLPGHGQSPDQPSCGPEDVARAVHLAVEDAALGPPVIVGHSIAGVIASMYAASYATCGVVDVDQSLDTAFLRMLQANRDTFTGPGFSAIWPGVLASMHMEVLPESTRYLLSTATPRQELVLAYWRQALDGPLEEIEAMIERTTDTLRRTRLPYSVIAGHEYEPAYAAWLHRRLPQAIVTVYPNSGHFPHLAHPDRFAECLASTAMWTRPTTVPVATHR